VGKKAEEGQKFIDYEEEMDQIMNYPGLIKGNFPKQSVLDRKARDIDALVN